MIKQSISSLLLLLLSITMIDCGKKTEFKTPDPTFLWKKNQLLIDTASGTRHNWSGFKIKEGFFVPTKPIAKFILWKEKEEKRKSYSITCSGACPSMSISTA